MPKEKPESTPPDIQQVKLGEYAEISRHYQRHYRGELPLESLTKLIREILNKAITKIQDTEEKL